ncbi:unnamed protein product, partial [Allacma fusca]
MEMDFASSNTSMGKELLSRMQEFDYISPE